MTKIKVREIDWDSWNLEHIKKHGVTRDEAEKAGDAIIYHRRTYKERYITISRVDTRIITLILKRIGDTKYYLITARDAGKKERKKLYDKENKKQNSRI